jgi:hypothetical protein
MFPAVLLFISGNWLWLQGWIFSIWFLGLCYFTIIYLYLYDPALLEERYRKPGSGEEKGWDNRITVIDQIPTFRNIPRDLLGEDMRRFMDHSDESGRSGIIHLRV